MISAPSRRRSRRVVPRLSRLGLLVVCALVGVVLLVPGAASGWVLNQAQLDDGTCLHAGTGTDPTVSSSATPWILLYGNGRYSSYRIFIDGVSIGTFASDTRSNVCINSTVPLAEGPHVLTGIELAPNAANVVTPFIFSVNTIAPPSPSAPVLAAYSDSGVKGDNMTMWGNPALLGTSIPSIPILLYANGAMVGGAVADTTGHWTARPSPLASGTYSMVVVSYDTAGNMSAASGALSLTVDSTPPATALTSPGSGSTVSGATELTASASDNVGISKVDFQVDGVTAATDTSSPYSYPWATTTVADGSHALKAIATDIAGVTASSSVTVTVNNAAGPAAPAVPSLTATGGVNKVDLAWGPNPLGDGGSALTSFKVYRATVSGGSLTLVATLPASTYSYSDAGLPTGTYFYEVGANNAVGETRSSEQSGIATAPATAPAVPSLTATGGVNKVDLAWGPNPLGDGGSALTSFKVYRATVSGGSLTLVATLPASTYSYSDAGLPTGTYFYKVGANNAVGETRSSEQSGIATAPATAPALPWLTAVGGISKVDLSWGPNPLGDGGSALTSFKVYRGTVSGGLTLVATLSAGTYSYSDTGLPSGTYYYMVGANNAVGETRSWEQFAIAIAPPTAPAVPSLTATGGVSKVDLAWAPNPLSDGGSALTSFKVYRGTVSGGSLTLVATLPASTYSYSDTGLASGTYYYKVGANNAVGETRSSEQSGIVTAPAAAPGVPSLTATGGVSRVDLAWGPNPLGDGGSALTSFKVYRGTVSGGSLTLVATLSAGTYSYSDTGLPASTYFYKVGANNGVGETRSSEQSGIVTAPAAAPAVPSLTATGGVSRVDLAWGPNPLGDGGSALTSFKVYRATVSGGSLTLVATLSAGTYSYSDTGLPASTYFYKVGANNGVGETRSSEQSGIATAPATAPGVPSLTATGGVSRVDLAWGPNPLGDGGSALTSFKVYRGTVSGGSLTLIATLSAGTYSYSDTGLASGTYYYKVGANTAVGETRSSEHSGIVTAPATAPAVLSLTATGGVSRVDLAWGPNPLGDGGSALTSFNVYRGTESGGTLDLVATLSASTYSYSDTGLPSGTYFYKVGANNAVGETRSGEHSGVAAAPATAPAVPSLTATGGTSRVDLSWGPNPLGNGGSALTSFKVYRGTVSGGTLTLVATLSASTYSYSDTGLATGTYYYKVGANNAVGETRSSEQSATATAPAILPTLPDAPTLSATTGNRLVSLTWVAPAPNGSSPITGYRIYRSTVSGSATLLRSVGLVTSYADTSVTNGIAYYYKVAAVNAVGEGARSAEVAAVPATKPGAPGSFAVSPNAIPGIVLTWKASSSGGSPVTGYRIYRSTVSGATTLFATVGVVTSYTDTQVVGGTTYYYRMSAVNAVAESTLTTEKSAKRGSPPSAPRSLVATKASSVGVALTWSSPSSNGGVNVTGYRVYRSTASGAETLLTTLGTVTSFTDTSTVPGGFYYYVVTALNPLGEGPASNESGAFAR